MLAQQGYVVMSVDNRGTPAPRGRAWRKIYLSQGGNREFGRSGRGRPCDCEVAFRRCHRVSESGVGAAAARRR